MNGLVLLILLAIRFKSGFSINFKKNKLFYVSLLLVSLIFLAWGLIVQTSFKVESQVTGWNSLGSPILEPQVFIAWFGGMVMLAVISLIENKSEKKYHYIDYLFMLLIWVFSIFLWNSKPISPNWFVTNPREPNFEHYPASDAFGYDMSAQVFLVGEGFRASDAPYLRRPYHTLFLTVLHLIAGQKYTNIVFFQIMILALIPVLMYLLAAMIHNRISGVIASLLITFREANSIAVSGTATTSHAKLLMSDLPATFAVLLFIVFIIAWFQRKDRISVYPLIAGGVLAVPILMRFETIIFVLLTIVIAAILLNFARKPSIFFKNILLFALGLFLVLSPWVIRNWKTTGQIFIDEPSFRFEVIFARYRPASITTPTPTDNPEIKPKEEGDTHSLIKLYANPVYAIDQDQVTIPIEIESKTPAATAGLSTPTPQPPSYTDRVREQATEFILLNPGQFVRFIITHYWNSQIQSFIVLPTTFRLIESLVGLIGHRSLARFSEECCSSVDYVRRMPYWRKWDGYFLWQSLLPLVLIVLIIALGWNEAWKKFGLVGMIPLLANLVYLAGNALFRNSGGRYILPVDWVAILYFSIGLSSLSITCYRKISKKEKPPSGIEFYGPHSLKHEPESNVNILRTPSFYITSLGLLFFGCIMPLMELTSQPRYNPSFQETMVGRVLNSDFINQNQKTLLQDFLGKGAEAIAGRALYPTYLLGNEVEPGNRDQFRIQSFPRINFSLARSNSKLIVMPIEKKPIKFPNASDVLVITCPDSFESVLSIIIFDKSGNPESILMRSPLPEGISCPLEFPSS